MADEGSIHSTRNTRTHAIEEARKLAIEVGTSEPPPLHELSESSTVKAMQGSQESEVIRVWDTGATAGMTKPGSTKGILRRGPTARVTTGAGVVKTDKWIHESLAWGEVDHVGLDETSNTLS